MKEKMRDKARDNLANNLNSLGVGATMSERDRIEEKVGNNMFLRSLGIIDISDRPIRWINIIKKDQNKDSPPSWWVHLGIPDERPISDDQSIKIKTVRKKSFPVFGKVVDTRWKGKDRGLGLIKVLSNDATVKALAKDIGNLEIRSHSEPFQGWVVRVDRLFDPTIEQWQTLEKIADTLLSTIRRL